MNNLEPATIVVWWLRVPGPGPLITMQVHSRETGAQSYDQPVLDLTLKYPTCRGKKLGEEGREYVVQALLVGISKVEIKVCH